MNGWLFATALLAGVLAFELAMFRYVVGGYAAGGRLLESGESSGPGSAATESPASETGAESAPGRDVDAVSDEGLRLCSECATPNADLPTVRFCRECLSRIR